MYFCCCYFCQPPKSAHAISCAVVDCSHADHIYTTQNTDSLDTKSKIVLTYWPGCSIVLWFYFIHQFLEEQDLLNSHCYSLLLVENAASEDCNFPRAL